MEIEQLNVEDLIYARRSVENGTARVLREAAGLSRGETARAVGVTAPTVTRWESQQRRPRGAKGAAYGSLLRRLAMAS